MPIDGLAVHCQHDVAHHEAGLLCRRAGLHGGNDRSDSPVDAWLETDSEETLFTCVTRRLTAQLLEHGQHFVDGNGKSNVVGRRIRVATCNCSVDTHHLTTHVHQWSTGVSRGNRGVGLNETVQCTGVGEDRSPQRRHDSRGHAWSTVERKGISDCNHLIANAHTAWFGKGCRGQTRCVHLQQRQIVAGICCKNRCNDGLGVTGKADTNLAGAFHNVGIRENFSTTRHHHSRAGCFTFGHTTIHGTRNGHDTVGNALSCLRDTRDVGGIRIRHHGSSSYLGVRLVRTRTGGLVNLCGNDTADESGDQRQQDGERRHPSEPYAAGATLTDRLDRRRWWEGETHI